MEHSTGYAIRQFLASDTEAAVALWEACGLTRPWNDPRADIARSLGAQPELFLVATTVDDADSAASSPAVIGTVMGGYDGHRGWMYYLATSPEHRGLGLGRALVHEIERKLEALGCPKAQLMVRAENAAAIGFYTELGYETNDVLVLGKRLITDTPRP
ncbi:GNAT family acetyltransferase [Leucobacter albus]|uniref:GNAT family acetyltransferase n=1 Tax=Leucobacter albus TaxID=272210 RepID=A0ABW3TK61_9MICO